MSVIRDYINSLHQCLDELSEQDVEDVANVIQEAWNNDKCLYVMGNGGSASTASHFARDLQVGTAVEGKARIRVASLTDNITIITSLSNNVGYEAVIEEQLNGRLDAGDVVIGISASGNSHSILRALEYAQNSQAITVGIIGFGGGKMKDFTDKSIILSSCDYGQVEDIHLSISHILSYRVKEKIIQSLGKAG